MTGYRFNMAIMCVMMCSMYTMCMAMPKKAMTLGPVTAWG